MPFDPSHLDTSVGALIRSGAGIIGIVLGAFVLSAKPRTRLTWGLGLFLVIDGVGFGVYALAGGYSGFPSKDIIVPSHVVSTTIALVAAGLVTATFWPEVRGLRRARPELAAASVAAIAVLALNPVLKFALGQRPSLADYGSEAGVLAGEADSMAYAVYLAALAFVAAGLLAHVRLQSGERRSRARLLAAATFTLAPFVQAGASAATAAAAPGLPTAARMMFLASAAGLLVLGFCFLERGTVAGWSRWVPVGLFLAGLAAILAEALLLLDDGEDSGFGGIASLVGLTALGIAIFRLDLLGVPVPRPGLGSVAALALAALFITAQLVQNFASSNYSLGTGAVVAGLAVLLANPLQKRIEGLGSRRARADHAAKYRRLVETAWKDGALGANERLLLAEARRQLGLDADAALAIDEAVAAGQARGKSRRRGLR